MTITALQFCRDWKQEIFLHDTTSSDESTTVCRWCASNSASSSGQCWSKLRFGVHSVSNIFLEKFQKGFFPFHWNCKLNGALNFLIAIVQSHKKIKIYSLTIWFSHFFPVTTLNEGYIYPPQSNVEKKINLFLKSICVPTILIVHRQSKLYRHHSWCISLKIDHM